jgi:hypothetical protein
MRLFEKEPKKSQKKIQMKLIVAVIEVCLIVLSFRELNPVKTVFILRLVQQMPNV